MNPSIRDLSEDPFLTRAIVTLSRERLEHVCMMLVKNVPGAKELASSMLTTDEPSMLDLDRLDRDDLPRMRCKKRKRSEDGYAARFDVAGVPRRKAWEWYKNCGREYSTSWNYWEACSYHPGKYVPDYESEAWAEWNAKRDGPLEQQGHRVCEGFKWTCCDLPGNEKGCIVGLHYPEPHRAAKRRVGSTWVEDKE